MIPEDVLALVPGCEAGRPASRIERLAGGRLNETWRVDTRQGAFVVRWGTAARDVLGVDRRREIALHRAAAEAGLAPQVVQSDDARGALVTVFVPGGAWRAADLDDAAGLARLGEQLARLHALEPPPLPPCDLLGAASRYREALRGAPAPARSRAETLWREASDALRDSGAAAQAGRIVHNDLHHSNLVGPLPCFVDWEYAAVADPLLDVASMLSYRPQPPDRVAVLLAASGLGDAASAGRLPRLTAFFAALNALWYLAETELAGPPPCGGS